MSMIYDYMYPICHSCGSNKTKVPVLLLLKMKPDTEKEWPCFGCDAVMKFKMYKDSTIGYYPAEKKQQKNE